ncbi:MAG: S8 family peptidase [Bacteroidetes bacterium]|nr:S8 family peptidase [Bacteroidota bacterium]
MNKVIILAAFLVCYSVNLFAEYNHKMTLDANSFFAIQKYAKENLKITKSNLPLNADGDEMIKLYVKVNADYSKSDIELLGGKEIVKTKSVALIQLPIKNVEELTKYAFVEKIDIVKAIKPHLDRALASSNVDKVHQGDNLNASYTGKGVIVGVGDWGFDFRHSMFSDSNGVPRVKRAWLTNKQGTPPAGMSLGRLYTDSNEIKNTLRYSLNTEGHGTHVLGIAAGSPVKAEKATYSGVAKDADIVVVELEGGDLSTVLEATTYMFRYADSVSKPISINYSLGTSSYTYHAGDGESLEDIALSELLQDNPKGKIVNIAAGNEGDTKHHAKVNLGNNDSFFVNIPFSNVVYLSGIPFRGVVFDIWGEQNKSFTADLYYKNGNQQIKFASYNTDNPQTLTFMPITAGPKTYFAMGSISASLYPNKKPSICIQVGEMAPGQGRDSLYIVVKGSNISVDIWNSSGTDYRTPMSSNFVPDNNSTISHPGTVEEVICLGAYISRTGGPYQGQNHGSINDIANFSSRGPLTNGKIKPDITAPGIEVVSAKNNFFTGYDTYIFDKTSDNNHSFISIGGTSMSSPMVAGIVALMLEKKPDLTQKEAKEIIRITAINDQWTGNAKDNKSPIWGWGKINAQAIMKYLEETNINEELNMDLYVFPNPATDYINIIFDNPFSGNVRIDLVDARGKTIATPINKYCDEGIQAITINDLDLHTGAYFLRMTTNKISQIKSFIVK